MRHTERGLTIITQRNALLSTLLCIYPNSLSERELFEIHVGQMPEVDKTCFLRDMSYLGDKKYIHDATGYKPDRNEDRRWRLTATGNKIQVLVSIEVDPLSSQFRWTSGRVPDEEITEGTTVSVRATVESRRPITYVIPLLKEWSGS